MKILLHCCCGPCAVSCISAFRAEETEPVIFWYNPNIYPFTEYISRQDCLFGLVSEEKLKIEIPESENDYEFDDFLNEVRCGTGGRCIECYRMRMEKTAEAAAKNNLSFSTSLLISPYQDHEAIIHAGKEAALKYNTEFLYKDFRPLFNEGQTIARSRGYYMQKYCGCKFSQEERYQNI